MTLFEVVVYIVDWSAGVGLEIFFAVPFLFVFDVGESVDFMFGSDVFGSYADARLL